MPAISPTFPVGLRQLAANPPAVMRNTAKTQRVLDLDLDIFLSNVVTWPEGDRPSGSNCASWTPQQVEDYLEGHLGLSQSNPIPGKTVETHDEVFWLWKSLIAKKRLHAPFEVIHVDAHADLGFGDSGYETIVFELLHQDLQIRDSPRTGNSSGLGEGNYLAFALACRWISRLTYVKHPRMTEDRLSIWFKDRDPETGLITLPVYDPRHRHIELFWEKVEPMRFEPDIPFETSLRDEFNFGDSFDFIFLAKSPKYTPKEADVLIPVIERYIHTF